MENHSIDPFKIFNLPYEFEINGLDEIYYSIYKQNVNLENINLAYKILKDPIKRLFFLCNFNNQTQSDRQLLTFALSLMKKNNSYRTNKCNELLKQCIEYAKEKQWDKCWEELQKYQYLKKLTMDK